MYFKWPNPLGGPSCPGYFNTRFYAVNSDGTAVAYCDNGGRDRVSGGELPQDCGGIPCPMLYKDAVFVPVPDPPCLCPYVLLTINGIETGPQVGGWYQDTQGLMHGFVSNQQTGDLETLDVPGALNSVVWGLNNVGQAALQAQDAAGQTHSYLGATQAGQWYYTNIDVPGAVQSFVHGINNNGDMVYSVEDANGDLWGVLFVQRLNQYYWFNQPDGRRESTQAFGISDQVRTSIGLRLKIVGNYSLPGSNQNQAYLASVTITP